MGLDIDWEPGIGDPSFMGWFTVFAYLATAFLCRAVARSIGRNVPAPQRGRQEPVWNGMAALFIALGVNKQLDLQSWFTAVGRAVLVREHWGEYKDQLQVRFIVACLVVAVLAVAFGLWVAGRRRREYGLLVVGVTYTVTFVAVRAVSFHHIDRLIGMQVGGVYVNWILELGGIGITAFAAWTRRRHAETVARGGG